MAGELKLQRWHAATNNPFKNRSGAIPIGTALFPPLSTALWFINQCDNELVVIQQPLKYLSAATGRDRAVSPYVIVPRLRIRALVRPSVTSIDVPIYSSSKRSWMDILGDLHKVRIERSAGWSLYLLPGYLRSLRTKGEWNLGSINSLQLLAIDSSTWRKIWGGGGGVADDHVGKLNCAGSCSDRAV